MPAPKHSGFAYDFQPQETLMIAEDPAMYGDKKDEE